MGILIKSVFGFFLLGLVISTIMESCKVKSHAGVRPHYFFNPAMVSDTPRQRAGSRRLTAEEQAKQLAPFIKQNFDEYFIPSFDKLYAIIDKQSGIIQKQGEALDRLSHTLVDIRVRAIRRNDSMNNILQVERNDRVKQENFFLSKQRKQVEENAIQINNLNTIANALLSAGAIMMLCIGVLLLVARVLWKKMNNLAKLVIHE